MPIHDYLTTRPKLAPRCWIAPNATVIGDVEIGDESTIWFGTVIRGDVHHIRIGARTNIQDNSVIHVTTDLNPTIVGDGVTVGHRVILHGCTVEDGALVGMGATILDRAVIGAGSLVGAGALVTEGTIIPPGVLAIGAPARVKRPLTDEEKRHLLSAAAGYVQLGVEYAAKLGRGHDPFPVTPGG
ncbi:gamma carbonic anhydrase family protein [Myxococcota bacterium]|nr:gamma carbonic anhydrase family protein [Myxococcota bacterium]